jgi:hypothetical protein
LHSVALSAMKLYFKTNNGKGADKLFIYLFTAMVVREQDPSPSV